MLVIPQSIEPMFLKYAGIAGVFNRISLTLLRRSLAGDSAPADFRSAQAPN
jgi:hypothetical protein